MTYRDNSLPLARPALLIAGLLLIAANLRAPITGVAPLLEPIRSAFSLSPAQAGLLTTLPLLAFAAVSPFAAGFARRWGLERVLFTALILIAAGVALRSAGTLGCLYLGTGIIGAGIAVGNVLLPGLIKRDFAASRVATVTGTCAVTMGAAAAIASGGAVPLAGHIGWPAALAAVIVFPLIAMLLWSAQLGARTAPAADAAVPPPPGRIWHSALAWQVTLFMGINSTLYYVMVAWLPAILAAKGFTPAAAGSLHGVMQLSAALPGLVLGPIIARLKDQKLIGAAAGALMAVALLGFLLLPTWATLWAFFLGVSSGGGLTLALIFMSLRASHVHQAAALSGMAQSIGYLLAATGPILAGKARDLTGDWRALLLVGVVLAGVMAVFGALAGRDRQIGGHHPPNRP